MFQLIHQKLMKNIEALPAVQSISDDILKDIPHHDLLSIRNALNFPELFECKKIIEYSDHNDCIDNVINDIINDSDLKFKKYMISIITELFETFKLEIHSNYKGIYFKNGSSNQGLLFLANRDLPGGTFVIFVDLFAVKNVINEKVQNKLKTTTFDVVKKSNMRNLAMTTFVTLAIGSIASYFLLQKKNQL